MTDDEETPMQHATRIRPLSSILLLVLLLLAACGEQGAAGGSATATTPAAEPQAVNPPATTAAEPPAPADLKGNIGTHDPAMIREDQTYYVFSTGDGSFNKGTIQFRRSSDLQQWAFVGTVFKEPPAWIKDELGIMPPNLWAPDISYLNGKYYLYYAGSTFGSNNSVIGLATNGTLDPQSPDYNWVDEGMVTRSRSSHNFNAIDPGLVLDADGAPWLALGSFWSGIKLIRLDPQTGKSSPEDTKLYALASRGGGPIEAPAVISHDGYYYLFVSFDVCCRGVKSTYNIRVGRASDITGPYIDSKGKDMMQGGGDLLLAGSERLRGPGGQSVFLDGQTYRLVYHAYNATQNGMPQLQIRDLTWSSDGWPALRQP